MHARRSHDHVQHVVPATGSARVSNTVVVRISFPRSRGRQGEAAQWAASFSIPADPGVRGDSSHLGPSRRRLTSRLILHPPAPQTFKSPVPQSSEPKLKPENENLEARVARVCGGGRQEPRTASKFKQCFAIDRPRRREICAPDSSSPLPQTEC